MILKGFEFHGLYAITDSLLIPSEYLVQSVAEAIAGGARVIQYREKGGDQVKRRNEARALRELCREQQVCFIVNDDIDLTLEVGADGVHLGFEDTPIEEARTRLGDDAIIGISCYNELANAEQAVADGADYIAFGRFFPSKTKPGAVPADALLLHWGQQIACPVVAIGGITPENGGALVEAGADMLAVIHGVFGQPDIRAAARAYSALYD